MISGFFDVFCSPSPSFPIVSLPSSIDKCNGERPLVAEWSDRSRLRKNVEKKMFFCCQILELGKTNFVFSENGSFAPLPLAYRARCCNRSDASAWGYNCVCASEHSTASAMS